MHDCTFLHHCSSLRHTVLLFRTVRTVETGSTDRLLDRKGCNTVRQSGLSHGQIVETVGTVRSVRAVIMSDCHTVILLGLLDYRTVKTVILSGLNVL